MATDDAPEPLRMLIANRLAELGLSARAARDRTGVSHTTIAQIINGKHRGKVSETTLQKLAQGLGIPLARLREAAGVSEPRPDWTMPNRFRELDADARRTVEKIADLILEEQERRRPPNAP